MDQISEPRKTFLRKRIAMPAPEMTFMDHLEQLRWHLVRTAGVVVSLAIVLFIFVDWIFDNIVFAPASKDFIFFFLMPTLALTPASIY